MRKVFIGVFGIVVIIIIIASCSQHNRSDTSGSASAPKTADSSPTAPAVGPTIWVTPAPRKVDSNGKPRGLTIDVNNVDRTSPDMVTQAFSILLFSADTRTDVSPNTAGGRAAQLATNSLARQLTENVPENGDTDWDQLISNDGYSTVVVKKNNDEGAPTNTGTTAFSSYLAEVTNNPGKKEIYVVYVELTKNPSDNRWSVSSYNLAAG